MNNYKRFKKNSIGLSPVFFCSQLHMFDGVRLRNVNGTY